MISFTRKPNMIHFNYFLRDLLIVWNDYVKDLGVMLDRKLYFHRYVDYLYSQALKLLGLIHLITYNCSSLGSLKVLYIALIRSKLEYASVVWNNLTLADSNKVKILRRKFANLCNQFMQPNSFCNYESVLNYLRFEPFIPVDKILMLYFLLMFAGTKMTIVLLWISLVSVYPLSKLGKFSLLTSVMSQNLAHQQGASRLQPTSTNPWTFSINITSPLRRHFPLLNPIELRNYRVTCVILLPRINFQPSSTCSSSLILDFVTYSVSIHLL
jgi:hypothetical protein